MCSRHSQLTFSALTRSNLIESRPSGRSLGGGLVIHWKYSISGQKCAGRLLGRNEQGEGLSYWEERARGRPEFSTSARHECKAPGLPTGGFAVLLGPGRAPRGALRPQATTGLSSVTCTRTPSGALA